KVNTLDKAIRLAKEAAAQEKPLAIALEGNAAGVYCEIAGREFTPDIATDQTAAHDIINGYIPSGVTLEQAIFLRKKKQKKYMEMTEESLIAHVDALIRLKEKGAVVFDYGNNLRGQAHKAGYKDAFSYPGFVLEYLRPLYCDGRGPCRWIALSGDPGDIYKIDEEILSTFKNDRRVRRWIQFV